MSPYPDPLALVCFHCRRVGMFRAYRLQERFGELPMPELKEKLTGACGAKLARMGPCKAFFVHP